MQSICCNLSYNSNTIHGDVAPLGDKCRSCMRGVQLSIQVGSFWLYNGFLIEVLGRETQPELS